MPYYKAVFFDLDETLRVVKPNPVEAFVEYVQEQFEIAISPSAKQNLQIWVHYYWSQQEFLKVEMERLSKEQFWDNYSQLLLQAVGIHENVVQRGKEIRDWFYTAYRPQVTLADTARDTLLALKNQGLVLGLLSNRPTPLHTTVKALNLDGLFDVTLAAGEIGYWKPDPQAFHVAIKQIPHLTPQQCIYVGDNYYADGYGASKAGLTPVLFDPNNIYPTAKIHRITQMKKLLTLTQPHAITTPFLSPTHKVSPSWVNETRYPVA